ncbi:MAG: hypothetical protein JW904_14960 [Spirochaetales bacterium]|nr:hypothetical protein [Spirochaetales bacterium]
MLVTIEEARKYIESGKVLSLAGDEALLSRLPKGNWIGGTIPYFIGDGGGEFSRGKVFITELPEYLKLEAIKYYNTATLENIPIDASINGCSIIIIPASSDVHIQYAENASNYTDIFLKPIIGWISGIDLADLGKETPKVFNGLTGEKSDNKAVVLHGSLPDNFIAQIGIINLFTQGTGDTITFPKKGFSVKDCFVNNQQINFADYLMKGKIDTKLPLVADYHGSMINVSFQAVDQDTQTVNFYAPVFPGVEYRIAAPVRNYIEEFTSCIPKGSLKTVFSCNCILNYLYSELEGKKTGDLKGPVTFGEIAYQLLNQTLVYMEIKEL